MSFKRRIEWRKLLAVAGWIGLGYFIGRPDQLERLARNLNNAGGQTRYVIPATARTTVAPVLVQRQPMIATAPQTQGWSQFSHPQGRFSVLIPSATIEQSAISDGQTFSATATNEFYNVSYHSNFNTQLVSEQVMLESLESAAENFKTRDFTVAGKRSFGLNGVPGVELYLRHRLPNVPPTIMRQMIVNDRLYMIAVTTPYPQNAQTFLGSFRLH